MSAILSPASGASLHAAPPIDRREAPRIDASIPIDVTMAGGGTISTELTNLSCSGFHARSPMLVDVGTKMALRMNGCSIRRAVVAWQKGEEIGCRFVRPLSREQLADMLEA